MCMRSDPRFGRFLGGPLAAYLRGPGDPPALRVRLGPPRDGGGAPDLAQYVHHIHIHLSILYICIYIYREYIYMYTYLCICMWLFL